MSEVAGYIRVSEKVEEGREGKIGYSYSLRCFGARIAGEFKQVHSAACKDLG